MKPCFLENPGRNNWFLECSWKTPHAVSYCLPTYLYNLIWFWLKSEGSKKLFLSHTNLCKPEMKKAQQVLFFLRASIDGFAFILFPNKRNWSSWKLGTKESSVRLAWLVSSLIRFDKIMVTCFPLIFFPLGQLWIAQKYFASCVSVKVEGR